MMLPIDKVYVTRVNKFVLVIFRLLEERQGEEIVITTHYRGESGNFGVSYFQPLMRSLFNELVARAEICTMEEAAEKAKAYAAEFTHPPTAETLSSFFMS